MLYVCISVSYTHLDVYKRQSYKLANIQNCCNGKSSRAYTGPKFRALGST